MSAFSIVDPFTDHAWTPGSPNYQAKIEGKHQRKLLGPKASPI